VFRRIPLLVYPLFLSWILYLWLPVDGSPSAETFVTVALLTSSVYLLIVLCIQRETIPASRFSVFLVVFAGILFRATVLFVDPVISDDMYRYIWDGKVQAHHIDPYRYAPVDESLRDLRSEILPERINFPEMRTVYPPVAEWFFYLGYITAGENLTLFKLLMFVAEILTMLLLLRLLRLAGLPGIRLSYYALCPLPILHFMIDGHLDALVFPFFLLFLIFWFSGKHFRGTLMLGLAIATRLLPVVFLPAVWKSVRGKRNLVLLAAPALAIVLYLPYILSDSHPFESLSIYKSNWSFNGPLYHVLHAILRHNQITRLILLALYGLYVVYIWLRCSSVSWSMYLLIFGYMLFSPTVHPWYITWISILLPFCFRWSGAVFAVLVNLSAVVVFEYQTSGVWRESPLILALEYIPVFALFILEILKRKNGRQEPAVSRDVAWEKSD